MKKLIQIALLLAAGSLIAMKPQFKFKMSTKNYPEPNTHVMNAFNGKKNVGHITWMGNGIVDFKVVEKYRNKGIGAHLFCFALNEIKKNKYDHAYWYAVDSIDYYRRFGAELMFASDHDAENAQMFFNFKKHGDPIKNELSFRQRSNSNKGMI